VSHILYTRRVWCSRLYIYYWRFLCTRFYIPGGSGFLGSTFLEILGSQVLYTWRVWCSRLYERGGRSHTLKDVPLGHPGLHPHAAPTSNKYNIISLPKRKKTSSLLKLDGAEHFRWLKGLFHEMKMGSLCAGWIDQNLECEALISLNKTCYFYICLFQF
jgi:hypothetical protein